MRMTRVSAVPAAALLSVSLLAGCGGKSDSAKSAGASASNAASSATDSASSGGSSASNSASSGTSSASDSASSGSSDSSGSTEKIDCPTSNTKKFAKTRFTTDIGLAAGTFHRWIYKPYQNGSFKKGHIDKSDAVKAAVTAGVDYKLLKNASENAKANPTLCNKVAQPLSDAMSKMKSINSKDLLMGNVGGLAGAGTSITSLLSSSKESGNPITENDNLTEAKKAVGSN